MDNTKWDRNTLIDGYDGTGRVWHYERCKSQVCRGRRVVVGFHVSNDIWERVVGDSYNVLCLACFDEMAQDKEIVYKLLGVFPIPAAWEDQLEISEE